VTFKAAAEAYNALHEQKWRNAKHRKQFLASLACYAYPVLGDMTVSTIDTAAVLRVVEPIWLSKTETANRVRGRIESVLDWATVRGHRSGDNPARWKGHLAGVLPAPGAVARRRHYPALPWPQIAAFMADLRKREGVDHVRVQGTDGAHDHLERRLQLRLPGTLGHELGRREQGLEHGPQVAVRPAEGRRHAVHERLRRIVRHETLRELPRNEVRRRRVMRQDLDHLQPILLGRAVQLHPLAVVLGVAAGVVVAGITGALLAVPTIAMLSAIVRSLHSSDEPHPHDINPLDPLHAKSGPVEAKQHRGLLKVIAGMAARLRRAAD